MYRDAVRTVLLMILTGLLAGCPSPTNSAASGDAPTIGFTVDGQSVSGNEVAIGLDASIAVSSSNAAVTIRFTTDGGEATVVSPVFRDPVIMSGRSCTISAVAESEGAIVAGPVSCTFSLVESAAVAWDDGTTVSLRLDTTSSSTALESGIEIYAPLVPTDWERSLVPAFYTDAALFGDPIDHLIAFWDVSNDGETHVGSLQLAFDPADLAGVPYPLTLTANAATLTRGSPTFQTDSGTITSQTAAITTDGADWTELSGTITIDRYAIPGEMVIWRLDLSGVDGSSLTHSVSGGIALRRGPATPFSEGTPSSPARRTLVRSGTTIMAADGGTSFYSVSGLTAGRPYGIAAIEGTAVETDGPPGLANELTIHFDDAGFVSGGQEIESVADTVWLGGATPVFASPTGLAFSLEDTDDRDGADGVGVSATVLVYEYYENPTSLSAVYEDGYGGFTGVAEGNTDGSWTETELGAMFADAPWLVGPMLDPDTGYNLPFICGPRTDTGEYVVMIDTTGRGSGPFLVFHIDEQTFQTVVDNAPVVAPA